MTPLLPALLKSQSRRTTFLSEGVKLCALLSAICVAPLAFIKSPWISAWLLMIVSVVSLGTFGIWAYHALTNKPLLNSEEHDEQMAAIAIFGQNRDGKPPLIEAINQAVLTQNPAMSASNEGEGNG